MSCSTCHANMHGGCVEPSSPLRFDEAPDPRGTCNHYAPRQVVALSPRIAQGKPEDPDRKRLNAQLAGMAGIVNQHARNVWDPRMAQSEGRYR